VKPLSVSCERTWCLADGGLSGAAQPT